MGYPLSFHVFKSFFKFKTARSNHREGWYTFESGTEIAHLFKPFLSKTLGKWGLYGWGWPLLWPGGILSGFKPLWHSIYLPTLLMICRISILVWLLHGIIFCIHKRTRPQKGLTPKFWIPHFDFMVQEKISPVAGAMCRRRVCCYPSLCWSFYLFLSCSFGWNKLMRLYNSFATKCMQHIFDQ